MALAILTVLAGLGLVLWSADRFVAGAAATARHLGTPTLLIGMVVVGFGTSAPEMLVSAFAAYEGNAGIALGNAYGSNITNIALILGLAAVIRPVAVHSQVVRKELPILVAATILTALLVWDGELARGDAWGLLGAFAGLLAWTLWQGLRGRRDALGHDVDRAIETLGMPLRRALLWTLVGFVLLLAASRALVWGATELARAIGISDLVVGLTVVSIGTSLPELASSLAALRKGEHDMALGNVLGSNLFNTLAVVGVAGAIAPMPVADVVLHRDVPSMGALTLLLLVFGYGFRGPGRINRVEGALLLAAYVAYVGILLAGALDS